MQARLHLTGQQKAKIIKILRVDYCVRKNEPLGITNSTNSTEGYNKKYSTTLLVQETYRTHLEPRSFFRE